MAVMIVQVSGGIIWLANFGGLDGKPYEYKDEDGNNKKLPHWVLGVAWGSTIVGVLSVIVAYFFEGQRGKWLGIYGVDATKALGKTRENAFTADHFRFLGWAMTFVLVLYVCGGLVPYTIVLDYTWKNIQGAPTWITICGIIQGYLAALVAIFEI